MSRQQLVDVATRLVEWINTPGVDPASLLTMCDKDTVVPIPYPGSTPDFDGLITVTTKTHSAFPDFKMAIKEEIADEKESRVVLLLGVSGTHAGQWLGIPPTGKKISTQGFMYTKINPETGLIVELSMIFQDLLFLQQIGAIPMPGA